jgi:peptidoglycan/xylan/chitin deacetylase (PgdA/CDA1 family)
VRPQALEQQVTRLLQEGYEAVTFTEAVCGRRRRMLSITFDDAFASVLELGKPILDRLGVPATIYAVTDFAAEGRPLEWDGIDQWKGGPFDHELRSLDWAQLRGLADAGWEVGSHTCDHPKLTGCPDAELDRQLTESRAACEAGMRRRCTSIAYPYGDTDARVAQAAGRAGYEAAGALPDRWHRAHPLSWPRVGVYHGDDERRFALKTSRAVRGLRTLVEPRFPTRRS